MKELLGAYHLVYLDITVILSVLLGSVDVESGRRELVMRCSVYCDELLSSS